MFDFHSHTNNSSDSKQTIDALCLSAIEKGLNGIAVTDHADMWFFDKKDYLKTIGKSISDTIYAREKYGKELEIFTGIEMAEYLFAPDKADKILSLYDFDVILGSVHSVKYEDINDSYSRIYFGKEVPLSKIKGFLKEYFTKVYEMAQKADFDILTHLNCPIRYLNGKYNRKIDLFPYEEIIREIFSVIIERDISLEINTSGIDSLTKATMPDFGLIKIYKEMGGKLITLGADAHAPNGVAKGFKDVISQLNSLGFNTYCYFKKRVLYTDRLSF